ncbi:MAG: copper chaperone PCu(A)C [Pseudomonadota bacterium]|jgi:copper(I)-binding protein
MPSHIDRRAAMRTGLVLALAPWAGSSRACEFYAPNFTLIHPWTRASRPDATSAIVSMKFQNVTQADRLIGVQTLVADSAELGGEGAGPQLDFPIPQGQDSELAEKGVHLRLLGLKLPLEVARSYPMTLVFANAGEVRATLNVDFARFA